MGDWYKIRKIDRRDQDQVHMVLSDWKGSSHELQDLRLIDTDTFRRKLHPLIERLAAKSQIWLAESSDVPGQYFGWACGEPGRLHYVFVKKAYRRWGIARELMARYADPGKDLEVSFYSPHLPVGWWVTYKPERR